VTIIPLGYRARCAERGCRNLARLILCCADGGEHPMTNSELCHAHVREILARDCAAGLKVYDDRSTSLEAHS